MSFSLLPEYLNLKALPGFVKDSLFMYEGMSIRFNGDESCGPRTGIITDLVLVDEGGSAVETIVNPQFVILWDEMEYIGWDVQGKQITCYDEIGVCTIPISSVLDIISQRYTVFNSRVPNLKS